MRENNEIFKKQIKKIEIYDDENLENMKKYYGIDDHRVLLKYHRSNELKHHEHYDNNDAKIKSQQSLLLYN